MKRSVYRLTACVVVAVLLWMGVCSLSVAASVPEEYVQTYYTVYTNDTNALQRVTIVSTIPAYTAYVDGSADNGGVYADGAVTWIVEDVAPFDKITVSFSVVPTTDVMPIDEDAVSESITTYSVEDIAVVENVDCAPVARMSYAVRHVEYAPAAESTPAAESVPAAAPTPAVDVVPVADPVPAAEPVPVAESTPAADPVPAADSDIPQTGDSGVWILWLTLLLVSGCGCAATWRVLSRAET